MENLKPIIDEDEDDFELFDPDALLGDDFSIDGIETDENGVVVFPGGVDYDYDVSKAIDGDHDANLAIFLDEHTINDIGQELHENITRDLESRLEWSEKAKRGLEVIGLTKQDLTKGDIRKALANGSDVMFPLLIEAIVQFNSRSMDEVFPASGPCKAVVLGKKTEERRAAAKRVADYINYQTTIEDDAYMEESDQLLFSLPIYGTMYRRWYFDNDLKRVVGRTLTPEQVIIPYFARSFRVAHRWTFIHQMLKEDIDEKMASGEYRHSNLGGGIIGSETEEHDFRENEDMADGRSPDVPDSDERYVIYETYCDLSIEGFRAPYTVLWEKSSYNILAIYRNWEESDPERTVIRDCVDYKYLPGIGSLGLGLFHVIGSLQQSATSLLRLIIDAGAMNSISGGFKAKDAGFKGGEMQLVLGQWQDVDMTAQELKNAFWSPPSKGADASLFQALNKIHEIGTRFSSTTEAMVGDASNNGPVGTTIALIEQGSKVFSAIHKRIHRSLGRELRIAYEINSRHVPEDGYPYEIPGDEATVFKADFNKYVGVAPVSDPNIFSKTQRIALAQSSIELAEKFPSFHKMFALIKRMHEAIGTPDIDEILIDPDKMVPVPAVQENMLFLTQKHSKAFEEQDHEAHLKLHMAFMMHPGFGGNPDVAEQLMPIIIPHMAEHLAYLYQQRFEQMGLPSVPVDLEANSPEEYLKIGNNSEVSDELSTQAQMMIEQFMQSPGLPQPQQQPDPKEDEHQAKMRRLEELHQQKLKQREEDHALDMKMEEEKAELEALKRVRERAMEDEEAKRKEKKDNGDRK